MTIAMWIKATKGLFLQNQQSGRRRGPVNPTLHLQRDFEAGTRRTLDGRLREVGKVQTAA